MKRLLVIILAVAVTFVTADAQILRSLGQKAKKAAERAVERTVEKKVEEKVEEHVSNAVDKADKAITDSINKNNDDDEEEEETTKKSTQKVDYAAINAERRAANKSLKYDSWDITGDDNGAAVSAPSSTSVAPQQSQIEMTYAKCDFVAGDEVFFEDNQANEKLGEFPSQWDLISGSVEMVKINGQECINFVEEGSKICPLMENSKSYLPEVFTLELDFWKPETSNSDRKDTGLDIYFYDSMSDGTWIIEVMNSGGNSDSNVRWQVTKPGENSEYITGTKDNIVLPAGWNHFALSFNKRALKFYFNGVRIVSIPNAKRVGWFSVQNYEWGGFDGSGNMNIKNIKIAKGAVPLYDRMISDGKFITYGITFDTGKSIIKPESMGEINRIVTLMTENPDLKFSVEGHTDNTGSATSNQALSESRSKAIVDKLVEMGISSDRLTSSGKGQNSPLADNSTDEGRAKNRRVEFVKK